MKTILETNPLISIIIPIYNSSNYLRRCLDSVLNQSYLNYECLLINDGSTDNSKNICDEYALKDSRFRTFHKKNEGISPTRNLGLRHSQGDWIIIIDSDDYIEPDYIKEFLKAPYESNLIIQSISDYSKGDPSCNIEYHFKNKLYVKEEIGDLFSDKNIYKYGTTWSRMYKKDIITKNKLQFTNAYSTKEDVLFSITYLKYCNNVYTSSYEGYHYIYYPNSLVRTNKMNYINLFNVSYEIYKNSINNKNLIANKQCLYVIRDIALNAIFSSLRKLYAEKIEETVRIMHIKHIKRIIRQERLRPFLRGKNLIMILPSRLIDIINKFY